MKITKVGIDLAKAVLRVHGVNEYGKAVIRRQLKRKDVLRYFANLPACSVCTTNNQSLADSLYRPT